MTEEYNNILINKNASVKDAMKQLDKIPEKILFVIDENKCLIGSLTDGDIRRWILADGVITANIENVCFKGTYFVKNKYDLENVKEEIIKRQIVFVPILDEQKKIIEFIVWDKVFDKKLKRKINKIIKVPVVIMAGGKGTRMEPFTKVLPKPLIPIGDKTILECIIDEFDKYGVNRYLLILNYKREMIEAYFNGIEKLYDLEYLREKDFYGTAGSLTLVKGKVFNDVIVSNCDNIVKADYYDVLEFHRKNNSYLTIISSIQHHKIPYGVVTFKDGGEVTEIVEKPEYSFPINTGIYILNVKALEYIPDKTVFHMTHLIEALIKDHKKVMTYPVSESDYIDIGQWDEYRSVVEKLKI